MSGILFLIAVGIPVLTVLAGTAAVSRRTAHFFQLESYQFHGYRETVSRQADKAFEPGLKLSAASLLMFLCLILCRNVLSASDAVTAVIAVIMSAALAFYVRHLRHTIRAAKEKKPFVLTPRVKRLYAGLFIILMGLSVCVYFLFCAGKEPYLPYAAFSLIPLGVPFWTAAAGCLLWPIEKLIQFAYLTDAKKKLLANDRLIRIGITGSYGKTSTKFILAAILSQKYNVLATPASFNTPMGLTRIIRERLTPAHQVFIGEMGARHRKDIRELCRLVRPTVGILTSVGPQHLDTFGSIENITQTKYDLIRSLPEDGDAYFQADGGIVTGLYEKTETTNKHLTGVPGSDAWAEDVQVGPSGSTFSLCFKNGERRDCHTRLLGEHNIRNILCCAAVARDLGLTAGQIEAGIESLEPVEHRLQLIPSQNGITVIDDAFNTNPVSSGEALRVLSMFPGRRIIVTPGMVELGSEEADYNRRFGQQIAQSADLAILVGKKHTAPIAEGLKEKGFPDERVMTVQSFDEALAKLRPMLQPGDTVMYENDLPDNYTE